MSKSKSSYLALVAFLLTPVAAIADAIIVDFEDPGVALASGGVDFAFSGYSVTSQGCNFVAGDSFAGLENGVDGSDNGTTHIFGSEITMTCGGAFDLQGFWLGEDYLEEAFSFLVDVVYAAGGVGTIGSGTDGIFGFQGYGCGAACAGILSARIYTSVNGSDGFPIQFALDDIRIEMVPEPGTLALLGLGLAGLGLARRRRV